MTVKHRRRSRPSAGARWGLDGADGAQRSRTDTPISMQAQQCFRAGCQPMDVAFPFQVLFSRAAEWQRPLLLASLDIVSAFDEKLPAYVAASLRRRGCPAALVAAWLRERLGSTVTVHLGPVATPPHPAADGVPPGVPGDAVSVEPFARGPLGERG